MIRDYTSNHAEDYTDRPIKQIKHNNPSTKLAEENEWLKFLIKSVLSSLPLNRDWLDPAIEKAMKISINQE